MTLRACRANQNLAYDAIGDFMTGKSLFEIPDQTVNRILTCGDCNMSRMDPLLSKGMLFRALEKLSAKLMHYDEWGADPEVQVLRRKTNTKTYRETHRTQILERSGNKLMETRIQQLKERLHENH
jgi:hypothetical protein